MLYNATKKTKEIQMAAKLVKQLDRYRLENKYSQEQVAYILGVAFSTVNRWFNGKTKPGHITRYHIRKLLRSWDPEYDIKNFGQ